MAARNAGSRATECQRLWARDQKTGSYGSPMHPLGRKWPRTVQVLPQDIRIRSRLEAQLDRSLARVVKEKTLSAEMDVVGNPRPMSGDWPDNWLGPGGEDRKSVV